MIIVYSKQNAVNTTGPCRIICPQALLQPQKIPWEEKRNPKRFPKRFSKAKKPLFRFKVQTSKMPLNALPHALIIDLC